MASPNSDKNLRSSPEDSSSISSSSQGKPFRDIVAWSLAHQNDPPRREKIERPPGYKRVGHGGPIRIISKDGVLTEYGKNLEQERLAKMAVTNKDEGVKEADSSS